QTSGTEVSEPTIANGMAYITDISGTLHAVNAASGKQAWSHTADVFAEGAAVANGTVYFSAGQSVQAVDAKTGKPHMVLRLAGLGCVRQPGRGRRPRLRRRQ